MDYVEIKESKRESCLKEIEELRQVYNLQFIQACVPLPFVLAIGSLQFSKTLHSVTCINCKLYTCLNASVSLRK